MMPGTLPNGLSLAAVRDLRVARVPVTAEDLAALEIDVLARAAAGLSDGTIASDVLHLEQVRAWFGRRADYGTSAAALEELHPGVVRPLYASWWTAAAWTAANCKAD